MNGQSIINHPTNPTEQLIGKFHVVNIDKLATNPVNNSHDETGNLAVGQQQQPAPVSSSTDEAACSSRFQMIRVDRNFGRGRWKVNDYEPPENTSNSTNPPVTTMENESNNISNSTTLSSLPQTSTTAANTTLPANVPGNLSAESNAASSATLAATVAVCSDDFLTFLFGSFVLFIVSCCGNRHSFSTATTTISHEQSSNDGANAECTTISGVSSLSARSIGQYDSTKSIVSFTKSSHGILSLFPTTLFTLCSTMGCFSGSKSLSTATDVSISNASWKSR